MSQLRFSRLAFLLIALLSISFGSVPAAPAGVRPVQLRCEYRHNPLGIDALKPRLSWVLEPIDPKARGQRQSAYRILVATSTQNLRAGKGDLWDSGRVDSDQSVHIVYGGKQLRSGMPAWWKVQAWDGEGRASVWSEPAHWTMGLLEPSDWKAKWIGRDEESIYKPANSPFWILKDAQWIWFPAGDPATSAPAATRYFRETVIVPRERRLKKAVCVMSADSKFELFVNGAKAGGGAYVQFPHVIDITRHLRSGDNLLAVQASNARNGKPAGLIGALRLEFATGEPIVFSTGGQWRASETAGANWQSAGFDDSKWPAAQIIGNYGMAPWGEVGFAESRVLPARMLRKEFRLTGKVKRATAYVCGLGLFELYLNGRKVGDDVLAPGLTEYEKRALYVTYDLTPQLLPGNNAVGIMLGNGRYYAPRLDAPARSRTFGHPKLLLQISVEYEDGAADAIVSDERWKLTTQGPIRANNEYDGEEYDARMELRGWSRPGFDAKGWENARVVDGPKGALAAQMNEPIKVTETIRPVAVTQPQPGLYIFDMGQNMVGWCRLKVSGAKGTQVSLRHAETLVPDGTLYLDNLRSAAVTDLYTLKGGGPEFYEPRFTYHGFRYVELKGFPGKPALDTLAGRVVHDAMEPAGEFTTSNALLNRIHKNILWGARGNYRSIPTDCPQRDERQGWLGDRSSESRGEAYLFDIAALYSKWITDMEDSQRPNGSISDVAPAYWPLYNDDVTWPGSFVVVPGHLYDLYGDTRVLEQHYDGMKKWIALMRGYLKDDLMPRDKYGDWCVPPESPELIHSRDPNRQTDRTVLGTSYFYHLLRLMSRYARILDKPRDAAEFEQLAGRLQSAFNKSFFNPQSSTYSNGAQTSSVLPLAFGMVPEQNRRAVFQALVRKIQEETKEHIGTGLVGGQWLMRVLSENGRPDLAYTIATQKTYPSWGYMIEKGATTIWELWNGDTADPAMNSGNHLMLVGDLNIWFHEYLAGIRPDPEKPGFKQISVRPYAVGDLTFVKASYRSMYGEVASYWKKEGGRFALDVRIPANTTATVYVPAKDAASVTESGRPADGAEGVKFLRMEGGAAVYRVAPGRYSFASAL